MKVVQRKIKLARLKCMRRKLKQFKKEKNLLQSECTKQTTANRHH